MSKEYKIRTVRKLGKQKKKKKDNDKRVKGDKINSRYIIRRCINFEEKKMKLLIICLPQFLPTFLMLLDDDAASCELLTPLLLELHSAQRS